MSDEERRPLPASLVVSIVMHISFLMLDAENRQIDFVEHFVSVALG